MKILLPLIILLLAGCVSGHQMWDRVKDMSPEELALEPSSNLCVAYNFRASPILKEELDRRGEFTEAEWEVIETIGLEEGMSELAVVCSLGKPLGVRTNDQNTTWQYANCGLAQYVYFENGIVSSWQEAERACYQGEGGGAGEAFSKMIIDIFLL